MAAAHAALDVRGVAHFLVQEGLAFAGVAVAPRVGFGRRLRHLRWAAEATDTACRLARDGMAVPVQAFVAGAAQYLRRLAPRVANLSTFAGDELADEHRRCSEMLEQWGLFGEEAYSRAVADVRTWPRRWELIGFGGHEEFRQVARPDLDALADSRGEVVERALAMAMRGGTASVRALQQAGFPRALVSDLVEAIEQRRWWERDGDRLIWESDGLARGAQWRTARRTRPLPTHAAMIGEWMDDDTCRAIVAVAARSGESGNGDDERHYGVLADEVQEAIDRWSTARRDPARGDRVCGVRLERLEDATGGVADLWRGRASDGAEHAVKILRRSAMSRGQTLRHFREGIASMQRLGSLPHCPSSIVRVQSRETVALRMFMFGGGNLSKQIGTLGWDIGHKLAFFTKLARGVAFAHDHGVMHRNIKPRNVLLDYRGDPVLTDFGLSDEHDGDPVTTLLRGATVYMSPEQRRGSKDQHDPRSDVYSLGRLLWFILSERDPQGTWTEDRERMPLTPSDEIVELVRVCTATDPEDRPPHAGSVVAALSDAMPRQVIPTPAPERRGILGRLFDRRR